MEFDQFYLGCLSHASYLLGSEGEAAIIDPRRDVDVYMKAAQERGLKIRHIFETHLHADFVSGHHELAERTGATVYIGAAAGAKFDHVDLTDGYEVRVGKLRVRALETPGHTQDSVCLVVTDTERSAEPWAVFTGDTLFVGDVGRPDLSRDHSPQELAGMLFDSLHNKLLKLADSVMVYPAHGAGSLCGKNMRSELFSTIGTERLTNYALQIKSRDDFVVQLTANLPQRPEYFFADVELNRLGAEALDKLPPLRAIPAAEVPSHAELLLDTRPCDDFAAGHVPGSVNISLSGQFASWAGAILGTAKPIILICESLEHVEESRLRLARVGIENIVGYMADGVMAWYKAGFLLESLPQIDVAHLRESLGQLTVLDVRNAGEWESGHIEGAVWCPLGDLARKPPNLAKDSTIAVHCKGGYRSAIACSLLQRAGFTGIINVLGGYDAWAKLAAQQAMTA